MTLHHLYPSIHPSNKHIQKEMKKKDNKGWRGKKGGKGYSIELEK